MTSHRAEDPSPRPELSVVVPVYNEADGLEGFLGGLRAVLAELDSTYEVLLVDDGSKDATLIVARGVEWPELRLVVLARNVGHQAALDAGLSLAKGACVVTMDGDGQHPASLLPDMLQAVRASEIDVVYTVRRTRDDDSAAKRTAALGYYRIMRWLTDVPVGDSQADFRLVSSRVLDEVRRVPGDRVLRLLLPSIGFRSVTLSYDALPRIAGKGRFGVGRQWRMAFESLFSFSAKPLRMMAGMGVLLSLVAFIWLVLVMVTYSSGRIVEGWTSVMSAVLIVGGLTLLSLSVVGSYVARIHDILKSHPRYVVDHVERWDETSRREKP